MGNKLQIRRSGRLRGSNLTDCTVREIALNKVITPTWRYVLCVYSLGRIGTGL
jgi:hypothetical protein